MGAQTYKYNTCTDMRFTKVSDGNIYNLDHT